MWINKERRMPTRKATSDLRHPRPHRLTDNSPNYPQRHPSSRQSLEGDVLKVRLSVLDEKTQISIFMVVDSGCQSDFIIDEDLGDGSSDQKLDGEGLVPGDLVWMKGPLHHKRMFTAHPGHVPPKLRPPGARVWASARRRPGKGGVPAGPCIPGPSPGSCGTEHRQNECSVPE